MPNLSILRGGSVDVDTVVVVVVGGVTSIDAGVPANTKPVLHLMVATWPELFKD